MAISPECYPCLVRLVELTVAQATPDPELQQQARKKALNIIAREFNAAAIPARIANHCHHAIMAVTHSPDPFANRKAAATAYLGRMFQDLAATYDSDLESLLRLARGRQCQRFFPGRG